MLYLLRLRPSKYEEEAAPHGGPQEPGVVAGPGAFDLDHRGAQVGEGHGGERAGQHPAEVGDHQAGQRGGHRCAARWRR
ncbi:hypothetical protein BJ964_005268 [Actinoplanes lobatus]|uniref:Uncharacterized protein n=1 Tax=Actinoplanes lobatus TaxID=113568 RepID=A0A7W7HIH6_9ACTN|nr:hypothetical protein [Actinoplanes lobatus]